MEGEVFLQGKKCELSPLLNITTTKKLSQPVSWSQIKYWKKKVSLIAFRQMLSKILPETCISSNTIMTYWEKLVGTKFFNTEQCPAGLSPRIIPHCPHKHSWETLEMGKNPTQQPIITSFTPPEKSPLLNLLLPLSRMLFLPHWTVILI